MKTLLAILLIASCFATASCSRHNHWADQDNPKINKLELSVEQADRFFADPAAPVPGRAGGARATPPPMPYY